jgi:hypothetical protein
VLIERHGITEVFVGIGDPAAVEANELGFFCKFFYFLEHVLGRQDAQMACVVSAANILFHVALLFFGTNVFKTALIIAYQRCRDFTRYL